MKKEIIGHVACPVCDHADAEVKEDKNGKAFIFCPDCNTQVFTRDARRDAMLRNRMRPVTVTVKKPIPEQKPSVPHAQSAPKPENKPVAAPKPQPVPKPQPKPENTPAAAPAPNPPKKSAGWFQPLLAKGGN